MGVLKKGKNLIIPYLKIIRPFDDLIVGLFAIIGVILAGSLHKDMELLTYFYISGAGFCLSAHAMVVNDIIDYEIDLINEPNRMLPSGMISKSLAKVYGVALGSTGVLFGFLIDFTGDTRFHYSWLWALFHLFLADIYNLKLKKTGLLGNLVVAYTALSSFLYGDLFVNAGLTILPFTFGLMAFLGNLSREILKGIIDVKGDAKFSVKTIAVRFSPSIARNLSFSLLIISMSLSGIIYNKLSVIGQLGLLIFLFNFSYALKLVYRSLDPRIARKGKHIILIGTFILFPFLLIDRIITS